MKKVEARVMAGRWAWIVVLLLITPAVGFGISAWGKSNSGAIERMTKSGVEVMRFPTSTAVQGGYGGPEGAVGGTVAIVTPTRDKWLPTAVVVAPDVVATRAVLQPRADIPAGSIIATRFVPVPFVTPGEK